jgi:hypoxanthine phosphoribosyltransferase
VWVCVVVCWVAVQVIDPVLCSPCVPLVFPLCSPCVPLVPFHRATGDEFLTSAKTSNDSHPGNLYVIHQFRYNKRMQLMNEQGGRNLLNPSLDVYLVCGWHHLYELIEQRIDHFFQCTGTRATDYDVVLGIYSGGALIAPFVAHILETRGRKEADQETNVVGRAKTSNTKNKTFPVCYMKCSRYKSCNMDPISLTKVTLDVALNRHDEQYKVSKLPDKAMIEHRNVLMIDDASVSGGTFRACEKYLLKELNATSCKGLALCDFNGLTHIYDPHRNHEMLGPVTVQKLDVGTFTPWGTF